MEKINRMAIVFILLLQVSFFSLLRTTASTFLINSYVYKTLVIFLIILLFVCNLIFNYEVANQVRKYYFLPMIIGWAAIYTLVLWGSQLVYNQGLLTTVKNSYIYFMLALYFLLVFFFNDKNNLAFILTSFSVIGSIYSVILLIQAIFQKRGLIFLDLGSYGLNPIYDSFGPIFHFIRIAGPADFISFALLITLIRQLYLKKDLIFSILMVGIDYVYIIFVSGTRMYMIIDFLLIALFLLMILYRRHQTLVYGLVTSGVLAIGAVIPVMFRSFTGGKRGLSFAIRLNEIKYYFSKIVFNQWFGLGFPDSKRYDQLIHGPADSNLIMANGHYYLEDIGFLGILSVFGLLGILGLVWFIYKVVGTFIDTKVKQSMLLVIVYLLATIATLSLLDPQRIFYLFVLIYLMEYFANFENISDMEEVL